MASPTTEWNALEAEAYERIAPHFGRSETRARARRYLHGLLSAPNVRTAGNSPSTVVEAHPSRHPAPVG